MRDATAWLDAAYQRKASGALGDAVEAFRAARGELVAASRGPDEELAEQARDRLAARRRPASTGTGGHMSSKSAGSKRVEALEALLPKGVQRRVA